MSAPTACERCLVPLLDALGWKGGDARLASARVAGPGGMNLADLINSMANLGFEGRVLRLAARDIDARLLPCLFVPDGGEARVLVKREARLLVYDGAAGEYRELAEVPGAGEAVFFTPVAEGQARLLLPQPGWFPRLFPRFRGVLLTVLLLSVALGLLSLFTPAFIMLAFQQITLAERSTVLVLSAAGVLLFLAAEAGFRWLRLRLLQYIGARLGNMVGNQILRRLMYLPSSYTDSVGVAPQIARLKDFESIKEFFSGPAALALVDLPLVAVQLAAAAWIGGELVWIPLGALAVLAVFGLGVQPWVRATSAEGAQASARRQEFLLESLDRFQAIQSLGLAARWSERYRAVSAEACHASFQVARLNSRINVLAQFITSAAGLATVVAGVSLVLSGRMEPGGLMACMLLTWRILGPMRSVFSVATQVHRVRKSLQQLDRLMALPQEGSLESDMSMSRPFSGAVSFQSVTVRQGQDLYPALSGLGFSLDPGGVLLVCGHGGSGGAVIFEVLLRLKDHAAGTVLLDGINIRQLEPAVLRSSLAYAPNNPELFDGTIAYNLRLSRPDARERDMERILAALGMAEELRALPEGLGTGVGAQGARLPDSFRKGLVLAQALLQEKAVLLLDQPDKDLSPAQEQALLAHLSGLKGLCTIIVNSNRRAFFDLADKAIWIEKGQAVAGGAPAEVAARFYGGKP